MARRKRSGFGMGPRSRAAVFGFAYGAIRSQLSNAVQNTIGGLVGGVGDEVAVGAVDWLVASNSSGAIQDMATHGIAIEASRLGEQGLSSLGFGQSNNTGDNDGGGLFG